MTQKRVSEKEIMLSAPVPTRHKPATSPRAKRPTPAAPVTPTVPAAPSRERIASLAYSYWEARGCQGGSSEEDWLRAEQELAAAATA
jgi:hypothetical protein